MRCQPLSESDSFPARPGLRFVIPLVFIPVVFVVAPLAATAEEPSDQAAARDPATNRLAKESSPYLLQHAHNPVDWYPWGDEAFERARRENKPVFLSVGYAACHWCHVMERETFTDEEIAAEMNERFVCIKVDREERPDVDQIYMTAVQLISGQGGWPMSVFMTPEAKPFWGGTYFPARDGDRGNATGFLTIVRRIDELWQEQPDLVSQQATAVTEAIRQNQGPAAADDDEPAAMPNATDIVRVAEALAGQHDPEYGGFGYSEANPNRPKFPEPSNLLFLLDRMTRDSVAAEDRESAEAMLVRSLDGMLSGAMWDHVAGGFHRYSVDRRWQIPHFEKMLYDNAQLAPIYAAASVATGREEYRDVAIRTCEFVIRDLRADGGAFYASLDADTEGEEGKYYRWTDKDLESLKEGDIPDFKSAADVFRLDGPANFEGEYHVPAAGVSLTAAANRRDLTYGVLDERLAATRRAMFDVRRARTPPPTDVKILTAWNGLMIAGLADTGRILERPEFVRVAEQAATFLLENLRDDRAEGDEAEGDGGRLLRSYAGGEAKLNAYADDYAFLASGLLAIHRATGEAEWLDRARGLVDDQIERYWDEQDGGLFYTSDDHPTLIVRVKDPIDAEIPSAASVTAENLLMLAERTGRDEYRERFDATMRSLGPVFDALPAGVPRAAAALATALDR